MSVTVTGILESRYWLDSLGCVSISQGFFLGSCYTFRERVQNNEFRGGKQARTHRGGECTHARGERK